MRWLRTCTLSLLLLVLLAQSALAQVWVNGYTRRDGKYVQGHYRSNPNSTVRDNYSYKGNTNPYTGQTGTNRYYNNPTSAYFRGYQMPQVPAYQEPRGQYSAFGAGANAAAQYQYRNRYYRAR